MKKSIFTIFFLLLTFSKSNAQARYSSCDEIYTQAQQGSFSTGYKANFVTNGTTVTVTFEMINQYATHAYLWQQTPFSETEMTKVDNEFSYTLINQTPGSTINYACKFSIIGGLSVTKYFSYEVGTSFCETPSEDVSMSGCGDLPAPYVQNTGDNMTLYFSENFIQALPVTHEGAYLVAISESGMVVGSNVTDGISQTTVNVWGDDITTSEIDGALAGEEISLQLVDGEILHNINNVVVTYTSHGMFPFLQAEITQPCGPSGCTSPLADNYDELAQVDDGSCIYSGCTDINYAEYWNHYFIAYQQQDYFFLSSPVSELVNHDDGSCLTPVIFGCVDSGFVEYNSVANVFDMGLCNTIVIRGCVDSQAYNFSPIANTDDGSCYPVIEGCMNQSAFNYNEPIGDVYTDINTHKHEMCVPVIYGCTNPEAYNFNDYDLDGKYNELTGVSTVDVNTDDGSCIARVYGCIDEYYFEFDENANTDDGSCSKPLRDAYDELNQNYNDLTVAHHILDSSSVSSLSSMQLALDSWNTTLDLDAGWNMFGYGCPHSVDLVFAMASHTDKIIIVKNNSADVYMPEYGFNGIGDLSPGLGYQIKVTEAIEGFSLCDWYVNDIPEDNIVSLQEENASMKAELDSLYGCMEEGACNFDPIAVLNDSLNVLSQQLDSVLNAPNTPVYQIGDTVQGGIVFYVDETGQHGLIAAQDDFEGTFEWGCYQEYVNGADSKWIGSGLQNTMDITNQGCQTENGRKTAAQAALDADLGGYSDWYLPSIGELYQMYITIGQGSENFNKGCQTVGGFVCDLYWSSSEISNNHAWIVDFDDGNTTSTNKYSTLRVRVIRAF